MRARQAGRVRLGRGVAGLMILPWLALASPAAAQELRLADGRTAVPAGIVPLGPIEAGPWELRDPGEVRLDRHGRVRAQLRAADGGWLQARLVEDGLAMVAPAGDVSAAALDELLRRERAARLAGRGRWAGHDLGPWPAEAVSAPLGSFVLVRGTVQGVTRRQEHAYLDFGTDWRRDFTVRCETSRLKDLAAAGLDVAGLAGKRILVRGWLFENAGPMMELVHPLQVEVEE